jgi:VWFA-related protein
MSTVADKCVARVGPYLRVACWCGVLAFSTALVFAAQLIEQPCQAQAAPAQNAPPPEAPPDPPPSLVKHPKPAPATAPAQSNSAPTAQPGSTTTAAEQAPQAQSGSTQGSAAQSSSSAVPSAAQNPAAVESSGPPQTTPPVSPTASGNTSTSATQSPTGVQASTGGQPAAAPSPEPQPTAAASADPSPAPAASPPDATSAASASSAPEINTRTSTVPLESHANLVPVRVVVHDSTGHAVENLQKDDFQVKQDGKLQFVTHFSVETPGSAEKQVARGDAIALPPDPASYSLTDSTAGGAAKPGTAPGGDLAMPSRFVALLFDDAHLDTGDLMRSRVAALRFIDSSVKPNQRLALYTVSGHHQVDFTDDNAKIRGAITQLIASPVGAYDPATQHDCLQITYYQADLIQNKNDSQALAAATADALACAIAQSGTTQGAQQQANMMVASTVPEVLSAGDINTQYVVRRLTEVVRRVAALPGQRSIVLVSPGFLTSTYEYQVSEVIDKANRSNTFINTLDGRGLYTVDPIGDISQPAPLRANAATAGLSMQYRLTEQQVQSEVLSDLAYGTGGFYFRNNNDLDVGFRTTAAEPEVSYLLAFVPSDLKNDGKFHSISVKLTTKEKYTVQARRGFFAPKRGETPEQLAKQDIEDALFSQEEQQSLPIQLHLQYYKSDVSNAKLSVLAHVDLTHVGFEKSQGRNWDDLTIVAALFDRNGNFITGEEKTLELRLKDSTLARLDQTGVTVKTNFDVKPGGYLVRLVVRDSKAAQLSARNGVVEIP